MTDYHIRAHSTVQAKSTGDERVLEVPYPTGIMEGVAFEETGFRHLKRDYFAPAEAATKVVIVHADGRRRVVKDRGTSVEPHDE